MMIFKKQFTFLLLVSLFAVIVVGCSSRLDKPQMKDDHTLVYPPKNGEDISTQITLCRKFSRKKGTQTGSGTVFTIKNKANIHALVNLDNTQNSGGKDLMFHLDWIGPNGRSVYRKCIDVAAKDSLAIINSSISISPEKRVPGTYSFKVYLFRELIAEKEFEIRPEFQLSTEMIQAMTADITLYRLKSRKSGKLVGEGEVFRLKEKRKVRALVEIRNNFDYDEQDEVALRLDWIGDDGESFYRKGIKFSGADTSFIVKSSISINPAKRQAGNYSLRIYLLDQIIAEQKFELKL